MCNQVYTFVLNRPGASGATHWAYYKPRYIASCLLSKKKVVCIEPKVFKIVVWFQDHIVGVISVGFRGSFFSFLSQDIMKEQKILWSQMMSKHHINGSIPLDRFVIKKKEKNLLNTVFNHPTGNLNRNRKFLWRIIVVNKNEDRDVYRGNFLQFNQRELETGLNFDCVCFIG